MDKDNNQSTESSPLSLADRKAVSPEVNPRQGRRRFSAHYKLKLLDELDRAQAVGEKGMILRREDLYSSQITDWRRQREAGALSALNKNRGRKKQRDAKDEQISSLEKRVSQLETKLSTANTIIEFQKKVSEIIGLDLHQDNENT